jgi:hypothetical protein
MRVVLGLKFKEGETMGSFVSVTALRPVPQGESWILSHVM